jgi:methionyl-tRNA synthetase
MSEEAQSPQNSESQISGHSASNQATAAASGAAEVPPVTAAQAVAGRPEEAPQIEIADFMKVSLRVAQILAAEPVPKSKKLLKLQLDLGPVFGQRQIVSGIALHYTPEVLIGKRIVVVANLKPAQLMGVESNGMLLAGSSDDNATLAILEPDASLPLGATVR